MSKISALAKKLIPDGGELVVILDADGETKTADITPLAAAAAAPAVAEAQSAAGVATEAARALTIFRNIAFVAANPAADRLRLKLVTQDGAWPEGVAISLKRFARDSFGGTGTPGDRLLFEVARKADGVVLFSMFGNIDPNTDPLAAGGTGKVWMPLTLTATAAELGFLSGQAEIDWRGGDNFGSALFDLDESEIIQQRVIFGDAPAVEQLVESVLGTQGTLSAAFNPSVRSRLLRGLMPELWAYGAVPGHGYHIRRVELGATATPYARIYVRDSTADADRAYCQLTAPSAMSWGDFLTWLSEHCQEWIATDENFDFNGLQVQFRFNWSAAAVPGVYDFTAATGGISGARIYHDGMTADYLDADHFHVRVPVPEDGFRAAVEALQHPAFPEVSPKAHYANRARLFLYQEAEYEATDLDIPEFVELMGMGRGRTIVRRENSDPHAMIQGHYDLKCFDLSLVNESHPEYPWHADGVGKRLGGDGTGALSQVRCHRQKFVRVDFVSAVGNSGQGFGSGISAGDRKDFIDCRAYHLGALDQPASDGIINAGWFFHNTGPTISTPGLPLSRLPGDINMRGCSCSDDHTESVYLMTLHASAQCRLSLQSCDFAAVKHEVAGGGEVRTDLARDRVQWSITGHHEGPFILVDSEGAWVLATDSGVEVEGDAAPLLFGAIDELGRGENYVGGGDFTLGNRLGDCSSAAKTLTIDGVSKIFDTDMRGVANATVRDAINAAIPLNPVALVDVSKEWYPDCGFKRRVLNDSGVVIPKGRFVKRTARGTIALAQPGDRIWGWTYRAIMPDTVGDVVIARKLWFDFLDGAAENAGLWGLGADGTFSAGAVTKLGDCIGGTVTIW